MRSQGGEEKVKPQPTGNLGPEVVHSHSSHEEYSCGYALSSLQEFELRLLREPHSEEFHLKKFYLVVSAGKG